MMATITARDFMVTRLTTLTPDMDVHDAIKLLLRHRISGAPVVGPRDQYLGVFSERCSMQVILDAAYEQLPSSQVGMFMDTKAMTIAPDTQLLSIAQAFLLTNYRRLPVIDEDGVLLGQVSRRDVLNATVDILKPAKSVRESSFLYISALKTREEAPVG
ncbi:CBS domain-containing protein [Botrimarina mediterranea]|uniref:Putative voltage-gated ClC-type chloride channel ClcB n=1 Tax=Botrimarina mediterranea TaxID=2528022 RepID=A0A518K3L1_9BACT|nr:CBS domain-containing protein [Botrimarina mediterranea]QDV72384.1 putative voltage-gated ClC-type chloride channel ClcB [Botrimarina mediterranea]QDV76930.1 putative voltage-gated ClC-type chloride channel ClcB [Planctomycetes bacterium K2D]